MNLTAMLIATLFILPATGLLIWAWFFIARVEQDLRTFQGFDGMHFEACAPVTERADTTR